MGFVFFDKKTKPSRSSVAKFNEVLILKGKKNKKMKYLFLLVMSLFLISCGNNSAVESTENEGWKLSTDAVNLYQVVGEKHDTAMLLMANIEGVRNKLRLELKEMPIDSLRKDSILTLLTALKKADDGMMNWMHEFKNTELNEEEYKAMSEAAILAYLKEEEQKIEKVHVDMVESIKGGKAFLE